MTGTCGLTVLRTVAERYWATKRWAWTPATQKWGKSSYGAGLFFTATEKTFDDLPGLVAVLEAVRADAGKRSFVVRGALAPAVAEAIAADPDHKIRRLMVAKEGPSGAAALVEAPRRWVMVDIDKWIMPPWADLTDDPDAVIDAAIFEVLPEAFQDAECWWCLSSSAGFETGVLKAHLFFWLTEALPNATIKASMREHAPDVDETAFQVIQPHYVADPFIEGGYDPIPRRTGWRKGAEQAVALPAPTMRSAAQGGHTGTAGAYSESSSDLSQMGRGFEGAAGFHAPIRDEIMRYARTCSNNPARRDDAGLKAMLRAVIDAAFNSGGDIAVYLTDDYLDASIRGAFFRAAQQTSYVPMEPHHTAPTMNPTDASAEVMRQVEKACGSAFDHGAEVKRLDDLAGLVPVLEAQAKQAAEDAAELREWAIDAATIATLEPGEASIAVAYRAEAEADEAERKVDELREQAQTIARQVGRNVEGATGLIPYPLPPQTAIIVDTGLGKTTSTIAVAPTLFIARAAAAKLRSRINYFVPTLNLAEEIAFKIRQAGGSAQTWRGRSQWDLRFEPLEDGSRILMCQEPGLIKAVRDAGGQVFRDACKGGASGVPCDKIGICGSSLQIPKVAAAAAVLMANTMMIGHAPREITDNVGMIIADEAFWKVGLLTHEIVLTTLAEEVSFQEVQKTIERPSPNPGEGMVKSKVRDDEGQNDLLEMCQRVQAMATKMNVGDYIDPLAALDHGLTEDLCNRAAKLEYWREQVGAVHGGQSEEARARGVIRSRFNGTLGKRAFLWRTLADIIAGKPGCAGRIELAERLDSDKIPQLAFLVHRRQEIRKQVLSTPVLLMDATGVPEIDRRFFDRLEVVADIRAVMPASVTVRQIITGAGSTTLGQQQPAKKAGVPLGPTEEADRALEANRRQNKVGKLADRAAAISRGDGLVISYQDIEDGLKRPGVAVRHWNDFAGLDGFKAVNAVTVIGRPLPDAYEMRKMAIQLTGEKVDFEQPVEVTRGIRMRDGTGRPVATRRYAHPVLDMLQTAIADAAVEQAIGRARGVWRTEATPVVLEIVGDTVTRLVVDEVLVNGEWELDDAEKMDWTGATLVTPAHAFAAYPGMWPSVEAARKAFQRDLKLGGSQPGGVGHPPISISIIGECPTPLPGWRKARTAIAYHVAGAGQRPTMGWFDLSMIPDPTAWLTERLGKLTSCTVVRPPIEAPLSALVFELPTAQPANDQGAEPMVEPVALGRAIPAGGDYEAWCLAQPAEAPPQAGVAPETFYSRGVLELPPAHLFTFRGQGRAVLGEVDVPDFGPFMGFSPGANAARRPLLLMPHPWSGTPAPAPFRRNTPAPAGNRNGPVPMSA